MIYGRPDPQEAKPVAYCDYCGGEIYPGDKVREGIYGGLIHDQCIRDYMDDHADDILGCAWEVCCGE